MFSLLAPGRSSTHCQAPGTSAKQINRRTWLSAATALFATSCVTEAAHDPAQESTGVVGAALTNPALPSAETFSNWNQVLRAEAGGRDVTLVNLNTVDQNIAAIKNQLGPQFSFRVVTKSLPSIALLDYVLQKAGTNKVMAFSEGFLRSLLAHFKGGLDILLGRPMPVQGAARVLKEHPNFGRQVKWLVDTKERLVEYLTLADSIHHPLRIALEIDVGLRRGGARNASELLEMLAIIAQNSGRLRFAGFMGYEGHVPFAPPGFDSDTEFGDVMARYAEFVQVGSQAYPSLFTGELVYNSGGSGTFYRYNQNLTTPINDIALGSAVIMPEHFMSLAPLGLAPAVFMAAPILKRVEPAELPFAYGYLPILAQSDPTLEVAYFQVAGGFPGEIVYPSGLVSNPFIPSAQDGVQGLLPNQTLKNGSSDLPLGVGDFVFYHPWEGTSLGWLSHIEVFRDETIVNRWSTFREGCASNCK
ncbi:MAG: alanine racemase [Polyangiaceae bacterium]|nr:alanine racemase [Polyangiaceae bacterium]